MSSNETAAYDIMTELDVDYVLVIFGGVIGYSGDDINKFLWMVREMSSVGLNMNDNKIGDAFQVRIAEGEHPQDIKESDYFTERGEFRVDSEGSPTLLNCLMYKLSYYRCIKMPILCGLAISFSQKPPNTQVWRAENGLPQPSRL